MKKTRKTICIMLALLVMSGCASGGIQAPDMVTAEPETADVAVYTQAVTLAEVMIPEEAVALAEAPAAEPKLPEAKASGVLEKRSSLAVIDYSNARDGYVMAQYTAETASRLKAQVKGPKSTYTYNITAGEWSVFPLSEGSGKYTVTLYRNVSGSKYAAVQSVSFEVKLSDEFGPFLYPNQYVDYSVAKNTVAKAAEITKDTAAALDKVAAVYDFVVSTVSYDKAKAASVKSGYLPVLDDVLETKKGICFDYAALMAGMLRSVGVPCKLVVGYAGSAYHAWISVWTEDSGWIDGAIYFDGKVWQRMDPTFASSADRSESIMKYIGDGKNYTEKYLY